MKTCKIKDCQTPYDTHKGCARGWCIKHYKRWYKHGDPTITLCAPNGSRKHHLLYGTYCNMIARCCSETNTAYKDYGGRGIKVCEKWLGIEGFNNFVVDMGQRPIGYCLERIDNNKGYSLENCKWATSYEQSLNRRVRNDSSSGIMGVAWVPSKHRWVANITRNKIRYSLGHFNNRSDAVNARRLAEIRL